MSLATVVLFLDTMDVYFYTQIVSARLCKDLMQMFFQDPVFQPGVNR